MKLETCYNATEKRHTVTYFLLKVNNCGSSKRVLKGVS